MSGKRMWISTNDAIVILSFAILFAGFQISSAIRDMSNNMDVNGIFMELGKLKESFETLIETLKENKGIQ